jgi:hypothetical protein
MPRYVILEHDWPHRHWDLLLEAGDVLRAWRLSQPPSPIGDLFAEPNADHRLFYLDYEGTVSGNRGTVTRWDAGEYSLQENRLILHGNRFYIVAEFSLELLRVQEVIPL